ncbi:putative uncharacterized protein DDB_G0283467 [Microcaecilia unicolor]|uniref:Uncharacterized protein n=1 Tax=Microcaecilia unicolor TaxID=1415580 RepID=A0A6P7XCG3_9AMPH|nr:putative uncharacterized protein DDB_G0283467 [Microcaecilia unicolor]
MARGFAASKLALGFLMLILALSYHSTDAQAVTPTHTSSDTSNTTDYVTPTTNITTSTTSTTTTTSLSPTTTTTTTASIPTYGIALVAMASVTFAVVLAITGFMAYFILFA